MQQNNLIRILIPIVAVVVVIESVVLVSSLNKEVTTSDVSQEVTNEITKTEVSNEPVADFIFETETKDMKVGKSYKVDLNLVGKRGVNLDAMEVYIKYDPKKVTVSKLVSSDKFPEMSKNSGIDSKTGLVTSMFLWDLGKIGSIKSDETNSVLSFVVTPKVQGETEISLVTGSTDEKSVTMIVENPTSKVLSFLGNKLEINATK